MIGTAEKILMIYKQRVWVRDEVGNLLINGFFEVVYVVGHGGSVIWLA